MAATQKRIIFTASTNRYSVAAEIKAITVDPSAAAWALDLTDENGNSIWQSGCATDTPFSISFPTPVLVNAINPTTWTNITKVIIYLE